MSAVARNTVSESPFDGLMGEDGKWSARDLRTVAGYTEWRKFEDAIDRAKAAIVNADGETAGQHHIVGADNMVSVGSGVQRVVEDYRLTRYGAYMVFMNGDPRKPEIAAAQSYFAVKTREAEVQPQLSPLDILKQQVQLMEEQERRTAELERQQKVTEAKVASLEGAHGEFTALGFAKLHELATDRRYLSQLGKKAAAILRDAGEEPHKRQDATFGQINVYPVWALEEAADTP